jgi:hypothetical protein
MVGIVPNVDAMKIAQNLGLWLSLVRSIEGAGAKVEVLGSEAAFAGAA